MEENRKFKRVDFNLLENFKAYYKKDNTLCQIQITDISETGFCLLSDHPLNSPLNIKIDVPVQYFKDFPKNDSLEAELSLVWSRYLNIEKKYLHGFHIHNISSKHKLILLKIIEKEIQELAQQLTPKIPKRKDNNYKKEFITQRREWISEKTRTTLSHIGRYSINSEDMQGNVENAIGAIQIPLGIAGPLKVNGQFAQGEFLVPLATTEGALVMTYDLGMRLITKSGGANTKITRDLIHIAPVFYVGDFKKTDQFIHWIEDNYERIKLKAESTTNHGKLIKIEPIKINTKILLRFDYTTGDAQGLNMINKATKEACDFITQETNVKYIQRANYSGVKKVNMDNIYHGLSKAIESEVIIPKNILRIMRVTPQEICELYNIGILASTYAGMISINAHVANGVAAIFAACGQDIADVSVSHIGFVSYELTEQDDLYAHLYIPNLCVGTVGGGTGLPTQKECLEIMDCYGSQKSKKFAEIVTASALAGEIGVMISLVNGSYVEAHEKYGRNRPK